MKQEMSGHLEEAARLGATIGMSDREIVSRLRKSSTRSTTASRRSRPP